MRSFLAFILTGLLLLSSLAFVFLRLTSPSFLKTAVRQAGVYEIAKSQVDRFMPDRPLGDVPVSKAQVSAILVQAVNNQVFYTFSDAAIDGYLPWLTGKAEVITFSYDLAPLKDELKTAAQSELLKEYQQLPECKKGYKLTSGFPQCQSASTSASQLSHSLDATIDKFPSQLQAPPPGDQLLQERARLTKVSQIARLTLYVTLGYLLIFLALFRLGACWPVAVSFLLVGLIEYVFSRYTPQILKAVALIFIEKTGSSPDLEAIVNLVNPVIVSLSGPFKTFAIACLITGGVFVILGLFGRFRKITPSV